MNFQTHENSPWLHFTNTPVRLRFLSYWKLEAGQKMLDLHYINNFGFVKCTGCDCILCAREEQLTKGVITAVYVYETKQIQLARLSYKLYNQLHEALNKAKEENDKYVFDMRENKGKTKMRYIRLKNGVDGADFIISRDDSSGKTEYTVKIETQGNKWKTEMTDEEHANACLLGQTYIEDKMKKLDKDQEVMLRKNGVLKRGSITEKLIEETKEKNKDNKALIFKDSFSFNESLFA